MRTYLVTLNDGQSFHMRASLVEAKAPIRVNFHDVAMDAYWQVTPYITADARHCERAAAALIAAHFRIDEDDCVEVASVEEVG